MSCGFDIGCQIAEAGQNFAGWALGTANAFIDGVPWFWVIPSLLIGAALGRDKTMLLIGTILGIRTLRPEPRHEHVDGKDAELSPPKPRKRPTIFGKK